MVPRTRVSTEATPHLNVGRMKPHGTIDGRPDAQWSAGPQRQVVEAMTQMMMCDVWALRHQAGCNQQEAAEICEVSLSTFKVWEAAGRALEKHISKLAVLARHRTSSHHHHRSPNPHSGRTHPPVLPLRVPVHCSAVWAGAVLPATQAR